MADRPRWLATGLLVVLVVVFLAQALYFSRTLVFSDDEEGYLTFGYLAARGTVSLFGDDVLGARTPLPSVAPRRTRIGATSQSSSVSRRPLRVARG